MEADEAIWIGDAPPSESYLNIERIVEAAHTAVADAIHPGFGFLAENPAFAQACADAGLIFIGPSPEAMAANGWHLVGTNAHGHCPTHAGAAFARATSPRRCGRLTESADARFGDRGVGAGGGGSGFAQTRGDENGTHHPSGADGVVREIYFTAGEQVTAEAQLLRIE